MKRVFIIHGWGASPGEGWFPWLKKGLEAKRFKVHVPAMPKTETPKIKVWVEYLATLVGGPDKDTYLVVHSIGCQTILRYLESLPAQTEVGGVVLVAPWLTLMNLGNGEKKIAKSWLNTPIDFDKVKQRSKSFISIFSDNDIF